MRRLWLSNGTGLAIGAVMAAATVYGAWLVWMSWRHADPCGCEEVPGGE